MKHPLLVLLIAFIGFAFSSDKPAYKLFDQKGKEIKYAKMLKEIQSADMVFFGENHTDPISHWLQYELTVDLYKLRKKDLILGAEMFEADNQLILDEYLDSVYDSKKFEAEMRLWPNYKTDYKPVVEFARENSIPYIATNIPRRYASVVHKKGFEGLNELSDEAKKYISPDLERLYDPELKCYADMMNMEGMPAHVNENFPKSQAAKDATMAYFILKNWEKGKLFFHFDGAYHSDNFEGIVWWINQLKPGLNIKTISVAYQENIENLDEENIDRANFIIAVPETMTQTNKGR
ncbi:MAG: ChaN family lipoprotein [Bacteroidales bacterium]|nr:ChaN family lipoprotein [Bacteroidales bacterium]